MQTYSKLQVDAGPEFKCHTLSKHKSHMYATIHHLRVNHRCSTSVKKSSYSETTQCRMLALNDTFLCSIVLSD